MAGLLDNPAFQLSGLMDTKPMQDLSALQSSRAIGSVNQGAPSQFSGYGKKPGESIEMPDLSTPDISQAQDAGAARAMSRASGRGGAAPQMNGSGITAGGGDMAGFSPKLMDLARAMAPNSDDRSNSMAAAGIGMAEAGSHGSDFLSALASGAGAGLDFFQKQRAMRANQALEGAKFQSEDTLRQAQGRQADAAAENYSRQAFAGNLPYVMMMAKKSGSPQRMMGPMGTQVLIMPDGSMRDAIAGQGSPQSGAGNPPPPGGGVSSATPLNGSAPQDPSSTQPIVQTAAKPAPNAPSPVAPPPAAVDLKQPYVPQGFSKDAWDTVQSMSEMIGPAGDQARDTIIKAQEADPVFASRRAGMIAKAEAVAKLPYETVDALAPGGAYKVTMTKDKWLAQQNAASTTVNPNKAPGDVAPPNTPLPTLDSKTLGVHSVVPQAPDGGGFPPMPQGASSLGPMAETQQKDAAETLKQWKDNSVSYDESVQRLRTLAQMYKLTQTNEWSDAKTDVARNLSALSATLGIPFKPSKEFFGDPAAAQIAIKNATIAAFEQARHYTNRITNMELSGTTKSVAQPDLQPQAAYDIIVKGIADMERGQSMQNGWQRAQKEGWTNPSAYEESWYRSNAPDAWVQSTRARAGNFAGMPVPGAEERNGVASYVNRKGQLGRWDTENNKFVPIKGSYNNFAIAPAPFD